MTFTSGSINIYDNRNSVKAKVVDKRDFTMLCDAGHDYHPPCPNNIVDALKSLLKVLGLPQSD